MDHRSVMNLSGLGVTGLIPAAGRGSRLGGDVPKALVPVAGIPMLRRVADRLDAVCEALVVVHAASTRSAVSAVLDGISSRVSLVQQDTPRGMGDALAQALPSITTENVAIAWCDQILLESATVNAALSLHAQASDGALLPVCAQPDPYVELVLGPDGHVREVRESREGDATTPGGFADCGFFVFATDFLRDLLRWGAEQQIRTQRTDELGLLPLLPRFAAVDPHRRPVVARAIAQPHECLGVNTPADLARATQWLARADAPAYRMG